MNVDVLGDDVSPQEANLGAFLPGIAKVFKKVVKIPVNKRVRKVVVPRSFNLGLFAHNKNIAKKVFAGDLSPFDRYGGDENALSGFDDFPVKFTLDPSLKAALAQTEPGRQILTHLGDDELGAFLPGLMKALKAVGAVTKKATTAIAKQLLPPAVVDQLAKFDPTDRKSVV
jgi:hypothetical protein